MNIIAKQLNESILFTMPSGELVEVTMLCAQGEECFAEPNVERAITILKLCFSFEQI